MQERADETSLPAVVVGVAGGTASGKTTISQAILDRVGRECVAHIQHDSYYRDLSHLPLEERRQVNFDHPDSLETELLVAHLDALCRGESIQVPTYDFSTYVRQSDTRRVDPLPVVLVEGILVFAEPELRRRLDIKVYVDTDADLRFIRRLRRDLAERQRTVDSVIEQYLSTVRPMHLEFVEPSKRYADVIIPAGGYNPIAVDLVATRVAAMIGDQSRPFVRSVGNPRIERCRFAQDSSYGPSLARGTDWRGNQHLESGAGARRCGDR